MHRRREWVAWVVLVLMLVLPRMVLAADPPTGPSEGGGSPEPLAALLMAVGALPTYLVYRRVFPRR